MVLFICKKWNKRAQKFNACLFQFGYGRRKYLKRKRNLPILVESFFFFRAASGIEPETSSTQRKNHTPRPSGRGLLVEMLCLFCTVKRTKIGTCNKRRGGRAAGECHPGAQSDRGVCLPSRGALSHPHWGRVLGGDAGGGESYPRLGRPRRAPPVRAVLRRPI